jgi:hypothetical protein
MSVSHGHIHTEHKRGREEATGAEKTERENRNGRERKDGKRNTKRK